MGVNVTLRRNTIPAIGKTDLSASLILYLITVCKTILHKINFSGLRTITKKAHPLLHRERVRNLSVERKMRTVRKAKRDRNK